VKEYWIIGCLHEQLEARVKFHYLLKVLDFICLRRLIHLFLTVLN